MGWFFLGSVRHRRNRNPNSFFHFGRFWCASSPSSSEVDDSLLGFERFSCWGLHYRTETCNFKEGFQPPPTSMLIMAVILLFDFRSPSLSPKSMLDILRKNGPNRGSKSTLMREGAAKSLKFSNIWLDLLLELLRLCSLGFYRPQKNQPILDQPRRVFWYVLTLDF